MAEWKEETTASQVTPTTISGEQVAGELPPWENDQFTEGAMTKVYSLVQAESRYVGDGMKAVMPIARRLDGTDDSAATAVVQFARGQLRRVFHVQAERTGAYPDMPKPKASYKDKSVTATLVNTQEMFCPPFLSADGKTYVYRCEFIYTYALDREPTEDDPLRVGAYPHTVKTSDDTMVKRSDLYNEEVGP